MNELLYHITHKNNYYQQQWIMTEGVCTINLYGNLFR